MIRRGFLKDMLGAAWTGGTLLEQAVFRATQARAQSAGAPASLFTIEKVAEGIYAAIAKPTALINCNAAIFENSSDLLIVDTHSKPSAVVALVSQLKKEVAAKPVRYIVNSHFHWDHTQGTPTYRKIALHADIVSSAATRRLLAENGAERLRGSVEAARKSLDALKEKLSTARTPEAKAHFATAISETNAYLREVANYAPELPNVTTDGRLVIHDKAHELHVIFSGRAHTAGDVAVFCPQKKVIATGDALHGFMPYMFDGYPREWPGTLRGWAKLDFAHVIPGHAAVQHSKDRFMNMAGYIEELTEAVVKGKGAGRTAEQLQQTITPASLKSLTRGGYGDFLGDSLKKYRFLDPSLSKAVIISDGVKENIAHIYGALGRA